MRSPRRRPPRRGLPAAFALLVAGCGAGGGDPAQALFSGDTVATFELTLPPASVQGLTASPRAYQEGTLRFEGRTFDRVAVRLKGRASFRPITGKASLKIKLDEYVPGQRLLGLRRLTFNNMVQDPSWARERLTYRLYRAAGAPAPRAASARLVVNGEPWGVYALVETLDDEFVEDRFGKPIGNLYDTSNTRYWIDLKPENLPLFERETKGEPADASDLPRLLQTLAGPEVSFLEDAAKVVDLDQVLRAAAVAGVTADWDGYFGTANNYEIYSDPGRGRFVLLPWGTDQTLGKRDGQVVPVDYLIDHAQSGRARGLLFDRCLRNPTCTRRYLDEVDRVLVAWDGANLLAELEAIGRQLAPFAVGPGRELPPEAERRRWLDQLRAFLGGRAPAVRAQVTRMRAALPKL
jgi:hypothetical protein